MDKKNGIRQELTKNVVITDSIQVIITSTKTLAKNNMTINGRYPENYYQREPILRESLRIAQIEFSFMVKQFVIDCHRRAAEVRLAFARCSKIWGFPFINESIGLLPITTKQLLDAQKGLGTPAIKGVANAAGDAAKDAALKTVTSISMRINHYTNENTKSLLGEDKCSVALELLIRSIHKSEVVKSPIEAVKEAAMVTGIAISSGQDEEQAKKAGITAGLKKIPRFLQKFLEDDANRRKRRQNYAS